MSYYEMARAAGYAAAREMAAALEAEPIATCDGCGCTDVHACVTDGVPCSWIQVDYVEGRGICSACVTRFRSMTRVANEVSEMLDGQPHSANVIFPNHRADRVPYIEIRLIHPPADDLEIEERWPDIDFEEVFTDEDGL